MLFAIALGVALSPLSAAVDHFRDHAWMSFSRGPSRSDGATLVEIATRSDGASGTFQYVLRREVTDAKGKRTDWAESRTCPAVVPMLAAARQITMPRVAPYGVGDDPIIVTADGRSYMLHAPATWPSVGEVTVTSNEGTPLADWMNAGLAALEPCWSRSKPLAPLL